MPVVFEVLRRVNDGEIYKGKPIANRRGNLWLAKSSGSEEPNMILCDDELDAQELIRLKRISQLIEERK